MRLKTFTAPTMQEAMAEVRHVLGPDAIIVTSRDRDEFGLVHVTAALDSDLPDHVPMFDVWNPENTLSDTETSESVAADLQEFLEHHRLPGNMYDAIFNTALVQDVDEPIMALAAAFDGLMHFLPFESEPAKPVMLIGAPGSGKTVTTAKLAADAILSGSTVEIITTDIVRAGAVDQIETYAKLLETNVVTAPEPKDLARAVVAAINRQPDMILIDTTGINPYDREDIRGVKSFLEAVDVEPVLVAPAGIDAAEAQELSMLYADLGCRRFIATKLDTARRFGCLLAYSHGGPLAIAGVAASPFIGDRISTLNPVSLARLIAATPLALSARSSKHKARVKS